MPEDVVDLILESSRQHLVGFIQNKHLDVSCSQNLARDHVKDAAGGSWKRNKSHEKSVINMLNLASIHKPSYSECLDDFLN